MKRSLLTVTPAVDAPAAVPTAPTARARRNPKWIALGVVALCLGALGSFFLYSELSHAQTVIAVSNTVYRGAVVKATDLTTVTVGTTPGIRTIPADELRSLVGQRAAVDLMAGTLLAPEALATIAVPAPDRTVVGVRLVSGRAPVGYLQPSSTIRLIAVPPAGADPAFKDAYTNMIIEARVVDSADVADGLSILLNVDVAADKGAAVGLLAAQERLVVVRDAER